MYFTYLAAVRAIVSSAYWMEDGGTLTLADKESLSFQ